MHTCMYICIQIYKRNWKSDQSNKLKRDFLPSDGCFNITVQMHHIDADKTYSEKARRELFKNATD